MNRIFKIFFLLLTASFGAACQNADAPAVQANQTAKSETNSAANSPLPDTTQTANAKTEPQKISFNSPDGLQIVGTFFPAAKENSPVVLMLHQYGGNRASYEDLARQFQTSGIAVLTIDGRGFGESIKRADGSRISPGQSNEAVAGMKSDVAAAVKFLGEHKNVDKTRVGIVGASYGSSLAIIHAGDDAESANASRRLDKLAAGDKHQLQIYKKGGHGTDIFAAVVGLEKTLLEFFRQNL